MSIARVQRAGVKPCGVVSIYVRTYTRIYRATKQAAHTHIWGGWFMIDRGFGSVIMSA